MMRCQVFVDPWFGSERYVEFDPAAVVEVEERIIRLFPFKKHPATYIRFNDGRHYLLQGHIAAQIETAQSGTERPAES